MRCCLCKSDATISAFNAQFCSEQHVQSFYAALCPKSLDKIRAGIPLHERAIHYTALNAAFDTKRRVVLNDEYINLKRLGSGSFGAVYRAVKKNSGKICALKVFSPDQHLNDLKREFKHVMNLRQELIEMDQHELLQNLPAIYDVFLADTNDYKAPTYVIEMEYIYGSTLADFAYNAAEEKEFITVPQWLELVQRVFELLVAMQDMGIAHCDIKPWNIMVRQYDAEEWDYTDIHRNVVLIDFGLSCQNAECRTIYTGTLSFMGPDLVGWPFTREFYAWLDDLPWEERLSMLQSEDVYAMMTVMFNVIGGEALSLLQLRVQEVIARFSLENVDPKDEMTVDSINADRREFCIAKFTAKRHDKNYVKLLSNPNFTPYDVQALRRLYDAIYETYAMRPRASDIVQRAKNIARMRRAQVE